MGYIRKSSTVANPAKKSLTVFQNSYQVWDHDDVVTGTRSVPVYTNVTGYVSKFDSGCNNYMNVPVTFYGVSASYQSQYQGSGSHNYGTITVAPGGSWTHMYSSYSSGGMSTCNWGYSYAMVGNRRFERNQGITNVGQVQTGTRTEQYEVSRTPVYRTDWNTRWHKLSA